MNRIQTHLVRQSFAWFSPCGPAMVAAALRTLADEHPGTRALFVGDTQRVSERLFRTLEQIVENVDRWGRLEGPLGELGAAATLAGARVSHYQHCREALVEAMRSLSGDDWSDDLESAWRDVLDAVSGALLAGSAAKKAA